MTYVGEEDISIDNNFLKLKRVEKVTKLRQLRFFLLIT